MKLSKVAKLLQKRLPNVDLKFDLKSSPNREVYLNALANEVSCSNIYDKDLFIDISIFDDGSYILSFIFDKIDPTIEILKQINDINEEMPYLTVKINNKGYLELTAASVSAASEKELVDTMSHHFDLLVSEKYGELVNPLVKLTYK